jgi:hypothetical protein
MSPYDWSVIGAALLVAVGLLIGAREIAYEVRHRVRRRRVRAEMAALSARVARTHAGGQRRPAAAAVPPLLAPDAGRAVRDPVIGVDQVTVEARRAAFGLQLAADGQYVDELRIEPK